VVRLVGALVIAVVAVVGQAVPALAAVSVASTLTLPVQMDVGQSYAGSLSMTNQNTAPNQSTSNTVTEIRLTPSCGTQTLSGGTCGTPDPGVFSIDSTATGRSGTSCAGRSFTVSAPDSSGAVVFAVVGAPLLLPPPGSPQTTCTIDFTLTVLRLPTIDASPATPGRQTAAHRRVAAQGDGLTVASIGTHVVTVAVSTNDAVADFDNDGDTDISVFRPSQGAWYVLGQPAVFLGLSGDIPVPGNFNGDGGDEMAVFRPSVGGWYVEGQSPVFFGLNGDIPVPADYNGDGVDDIAVFRPSVGGWYIQGQSTVFHGLSTDMPVPADYDGNTRDDIAVFRPSVGGWYVQGQDPVFHGLNGDIPVPADYSGNGSDEMAVFRPSDGGWYVQGQGAVFHGLSGDIPVPGNYDNDLADEIAVFRRTTGGWTVVATPTVFHGTTGDVPLSLPHAIYRSFTFAGG
jgi:hypothetical protein